VPVPTHTSIARLNLTGDALTPGAQRSWWLREALAVEPSSDCPPLAKDVDADVVIVGGGFTGLWTAYFPVLAATAALEVAIMRTRR
jgi:hypothetical protein